MKQPTKISNKRKAAPIAAAGGASGGVAKKPKLAGKKSSQAETNPRTGKPARKPNQPKKVKLRDQKLIPVPKSAFIGDRNEGDEEEESEDDGVEDHGMLIDDGAGSDEEGEARPAAHDGRANFASGVDVKGIARSRKETSRLHALQKEREPLPKPGKKRRLERSPSISTVSSFEDDEDEDEKIDDELMDGAEPGSAGRGKASVQRKGKERAIDDGYESGYTLSEGEGAAAGADDSEGESPLGSDDEDSDMSDSEASSSGSSGSSAAAAAEIQRLRRKTRKLDEEEADYETAGRRRHGQNGSQAQGGEEAAKLEDDVGHLPIKLANGEVEHVPGTTRITIPASLPLKKGRQPAPKPSSDNESALSDSDAESASEGEQAANLATKKGRFGRMGIVDILTKDPSEMDLGGKGRKKAEVRLGWAKEEIARMGAEIMGGGELLDNLPLLTRLSTFALEKVRIPDEDVPPVPVPNSIRGLAFLSQLAVYKDLLPGYRIRELTALEQVEKVRAEVKRLREGEKGLVKSYKGYLKTLEAEIKKRSPLISLSLKCMCELLVTSPHFNFAENIMGVIVARLSRRSWDADSELCLQAVISVFKNDHAARYSGTLLRLIARMMKERHYRVHPNVMDALLSLRLRSELSIDKDGNTKWKRGGFNKDEKWKGIKAKSEVRKQWMTKNKKKADKERKEVEREMEEAEAEVDVEERSRNQTETLKNLFVLYFSILKQPRRSPLLPAALEGLSKFAHLVNIEFFRDLLIVLKKIVSGEMFDEGGESDGEAEFGEGLGHGASGGDVRLKMLTIVTAFELLSGQGEALNIDLNTFIVQFYTLLQPLSLDTNIEQQPSARPGSRQILRKGKNGKPSVALLASTADLMFRCLNLIFFSRHSSTASSPPWRAAAFAKRLLECALHFPTATALRAIGFIKQLVNKEAKLEALLSTEDRTADGIYRPDLGDPQLVNAFATSFWELGLLQRDHWNDDVRLQAGQLATGKLV